MAKLRTTREGLIKRLTEVMSVQTTTYMTKRMNSYITGYVKGIPDCKIYKKEGNIYVTRGESDLYPCVVAHTDTVHDIHKEFWVKRHDDVLYAINERYERAGIGGDDKVGIFVALEILRNNEVCKVAFFRDEEVGCEGSRLADMSFFEDVSFVLQCDRQGYSDFVSNISWTKLYCDSFGKTIAPLLTEFDRVESDGGMTDVLQLAENGLKVSCANMSCGYYDPHSDNEYIKITEVFKTLSFVQAVIDKMGSTKWDFDPKDRDCGGYSRYGGYGGGYKRGKGWSVNSTKTYKSYGRGAEFLRDDWYPCDPFDDEVRDVHDTVSCYCTQCDNVGQVEYDSTAEMFWCYNCQDYVDDGDLEFDDVDCPE